MKHLKLMSTAYRLWLPAHKFGLAEREGNVAEPNHVLQKTIYKLSSLNCNLYRQTRICKKSRSFNHLAIHILSFKRDWFENIHRTPAQKHEHETKSHLKDIPTSILP